MRATTISMVLVLALAQMVSATQTLTMNNEAVDEVTLKTGQICIVQIVSDNSNPYSVYVGFDDRVVLGSFYNGAAMADDILSIGVLSGIISISCSFILL